jgi:hypothetical protein
MTRQTSSLLLSLAAAVAFVTPLALMLYLGVHPFAALLLLACIVCGGAVLALYLASRRET